jgi:hypothetical protein
VTGGTIIIESAPPRTSSIRSWTRAVRPVVYLATARSRFEPR